MRTAARIARFSITLLACREPPRGAGVDRSRLDGMGDTAPTAGAPATRPAGPHAPPGRLSRTPSSLAGSGRPAAGAGDPRADSPAPRAPPAPPGGSFALASAGLGAARSAGPLGDRHEHVPHLGHEGLKPGGLGALAPDEDHRDPLAEAAPLEAVRLSQPASHAVASHGAAHLAAHREPHLSIPGRLVPEGDEPGPLDSLALLENRLELAGSTETLGRGKGLGPEGSRHLPIATRPGASAPSRAAPSGPSGPPWSSCARETRESFSGADDSAETSSSCGFPFTGTTPTTYSPSAGKSSFLTPLRPLFPLWYLALPRLVVSRLARVPDGPRTACAGGGGGGSPDRTRGAARAGVA